MWTETDPYTGDDFYDPYPDRETNTDPGRTRPKSRESASPDGGILTTEEAGGIHSGGWGDPESLPYPRYLPLGIRGRAVSALEQEVETSGEQSLVKDDGNGKEHQTLETPTAWGISASQRPSFPHVVTRNSVITLGSVEFPSVSPHRRSRSASSYSAMTNESRSHLEPGALSRLLNLQVPTSANQNTADANQTASQTTNSVDGKQNADITPDLVGSGGQDEKPQKLRKLQKLQKLRKFIKLLKLSKSSTSSSSKWPKWLPKWPKRSKKKSTKTPVPEIRPPTSSKPSEPHTPRGVPEPGGVGSLDRIRGRGGDCSWFKGESVVWWERKSHITECVQFELEHRGIVLIIPPNNADNFYGRDIASIFSTGASPNERYRAMFPWNDQIPIAMQRVHLPQLGKILSPMDQTMRFSDIPTTQHVMKVISNFIFENNVLTPPTSGIAPSDSQPSLKSRPHTPFGDRITTDEAANTPHGMRLIIDNSIFSEFDFPLLCTLIHHWSGSYLQEHIGADLNQEIPKLDLGNLGVQDFGYRIERLQSLSQNPPVIKNPYTVFPRRLWDLRVNRVIPFYLMQLPGNMHGNSRLFGHQFPPYIAISHSWVGEAELEYVYTSINQASWAVPLPKGTNLECIRNEVLGHFPSIRYCWLDVLCLRQSPRTEDRGGSMSGLDCLELGTSNLERQSEEMSVDVPTIGNIYQRAVGVLRYFNGLGKAFESTGWDHEKHWLNRAWTLQETISSSVNGGLLDSYSNPLNTQSPWRGSSRRLRDCLREVEKILRKTNSARSMIALAREMRQRYASNEVDKIAGLSYLLHFDQLPTYSKDEAVEDAWKRCLNNAPNTMLAELFFNCPFSNLNGIFPTWEQLTSCPACLVPQQIPNTNSVAITRKNSRVIIEEGTGEIMVEEALCFVPRQLLFTKKLKFYGYRLLAQILKPEEDVDVVVAPQQQQQQQQNDQHPTHYRVRAKAKPESRYPDMAINLKFFIAHTGVDLHLSDNPDTLYSLFTHNLTPCSSWVVILDGKKIGMVCSDEMFGGLHRSQVVEKGKIEKDETDKLKFHPRKLK